MINGLKNFWKRASSYVLGHPSDPNKLIYESKGGGLGLFSGAVTSYSAMGNPTVYACVNIRAQSVASIPLKLYKKTPTGKKTATEHPAYKLLSLMSNPYMTSFMLREYMQTCLDLKGNAYAQIVWENGYPAALYPIDPARVRIKIEKGVKSFRVLMNDGREREFQKEEILHISNVSLDGVYGASVLALHRATFQKSQMQSDYSNNFFNNAAIPSGAFSTPGELSEDAFKRLKQDLREEWAGVQNAGKPMLLENDLKFVPLTMNADDMAYIEQMKFSELQICQIFQTPPHMVGILDRATFSNIEEQNTDFYRRTLFALYVRWEMELNTTLLIPKEQLKYYFKFDVRAFLRGNALARYQVYAIARNWGIMSLNEIRDLEDLDLLDPEIGDVHLEPLNMKKAGEDDPSQMPADDEDAKKKPKLPKGPNKGNAKEKDEEKKDFEDLFETRGEDLLRPAFSEIFKDLLHRAVSKHTLALLKRAPKATVTSWRSDYCGFFIEEKDKTFDLLQAAIGGYCKMSGVGFEQERAMISEFVTGYQERAVAELDAAGFDPAAVQVLMDDWMSSRAVDETEKLFAILEREKS